MAKSARPRLISLRDEYRNAIAIGNARRICADLERGEIVSVAFVLVRRSGYVSTGWDNCKATDIHALHSGAYLLSHRLTAAMNDGSEDA